MYRCLPPTGHFTYCENKEDVTQRVKLDLADEEITKVEKLKSKIESIDNWQKVFTFEGERKLVYATEALTPKPKANRGKINLLLLLGNPAIHSVIDGMFFSYEGKKGGGKKEHRFWEGLRCCGLCKEPKLPLEKFIDDKYIAAIHDRKLKLLNGHYEGNHEFNLFLMTYFSFPTPPSKKRDGSIDYSGVAGIKKIFRESCMSEILEEMRVFEFCRFMHVVSSNKIADVICFQKEAWGEVIKMVKPENVTCIQRPINNDLKGRVRRINLDSVSTNPTIYLAKPTRDMRSKESKELLEAILCDIKAGVN